MMPMRPTQRAMLERKRRREVITLDLTIADIECTEELRGYRDEMVRNGRMTREILDMIEAREKQMRGVG